MSSPESQEPPVHKPRFDPVLWWLSIAGICALIAMGALATFKYRKLILEQAAHPRPYFLAKLVDFQAVNRDGVPVSFSQLEGKVWVAGYQYTDCPGGCLGMAAVMKTLHEKFGARPDFHLVSISLNPAEDTPEKMDAWVRDKGVAAPNWWFLTGDEQKIRDYMIRHFKFFGVRHNTDPALVASEGKFSHDQRLALVDGQANVRGMYEVMHSERGGAEIDRLVRDIAYLFAENPAAPAPEAPPRP